MIKFVVTRNGQEADIRFPCEEKDIRRVQDKLGIPYETDTRVKVLAVDSDIEQLSILEGQTADMDFLNLLGRLMYGMDKHEYDQFRMGLYHESPSELKDIIMGAQNAEIDVVAGATITSNAVLTAARACIAQAVKE